MELSWRVFKVGKALVDGGHRATDFSELLCHGGGRFVARVSVDAQHVREVGHVVSWCHARVRHVLGDPRPWRGRVFGAKHARDALHPWPCASSGADGRKASVERPEDAVDIAFVAEELAVIQVPNIEKRYALLG